MEVRCHLFSYYQVSGSIIYDDSLALEDDLLAENVTIWTHLHQGDLDSNYCEDALQLAIDLSVDDDSGS